MQVLTFEGVPAALARRVRAALRRRDDTRLQAGADGGFRWRQHEGRFAYDAGGATLRIEIGGEAADEVFANTALELWNQRQELAAIG